MRFKSLQTVKKISDQFTNDIALGFADGRMNNLFHDPLRIISAFNSFAQVRPFRHPSVSNFERPTSFFTAGSYKFRTTMIRRPYVFQDVIMMVGMLFQSHAICNGANGFGRTVDRSARARFAWTVHPAISDH